MIELQSVGLKFGLATKKSSEYKYAESFKQRKEALFSAVRESLAFWNFEYSEMLPLVMPAQLLLPWQVLNLKATGYDIREKSPFEIEKPFVIPLRVLNSETEFEQWANTYISYTPTDSNILSAFDYNIDKGRMRFKGQVAITDMDGYKGEGLYCLVLPGYAISEDGYLEDNASLTYIVSEPFSFSKSVDDFTTFLFGNNINLALGNGAEIDFSDGFFFKMLLPAQLGRPAYVFEETLTERQGYKFIESQVSKKTYDLTIPANESMCDTLRIARLCCNRQMKSLDRYHDVIAMDMTVEWLEQGDIASVKITIEEDNIINHSGGYLGETNIGDFSEDDFNNDFFDVENRGFMQTFHYKDEGGGLAEYESSCNNQQWIGENDDILIPSGVERASKLIISFDVLHADGAIRIAVYDKTDYSWKNVLEKTFLQSIVDAGGTKTIEIDLSDMDIEAVEFLRANKSANTSVSEIQGFVKLS